MAYIVRMPKLGVEMQTGVVLEWTVEEGAAVDEGDVIAKIESEKTVAEVTAREAGVLRRIVLEAGTEVEPGTPMGIVAAPEAEIDDLLSTVADEREGAAAVDEATAAGGPGDERPGDAAPATRDQSPAREPAGDRGPPEAEEPPAPRATPKARARAAAEGVDLSAVRGTGPKGSVTVDDIERAADAGASTTVEPVARSGGVGAPAATARDRGGPETGPALVTPRARKRAAELDIDLERVPGSGPHGSIRAGDVEAAAGGAGTEQAARGSPAGAAVGRPEPAEAGAGPTVVEERRLTGTRATIARRLSASWEAPHVTVDRRIDVEAALDAADRAGDEVAITDVVMQAVSETLADHPSFNATFEDDVHRLYDEHNIGFAVDAEAGLLTPVLEGVDRMSTRELAAERRALTERVRTQRHSAAELQGGTFTVSNLGMFGVDSFTPIINPPQVAILGVNRISEEPVRTDRGIEFRRTMGFSLSFDHRVIDGADAARFLETFADHLQGAEELLDG